MKGRILGADEKREKDGVLFIVDLQNFMYFLGSFCAAGWKIGSNFFQKHLARMSNPPTFALPIEIKPSGSKRKGGSETAESSLKEWKQ